MGGAERQALSLGRYLLHEQGARVQVWGFCNPGRAVELCEEYGIPWRIVPVKIRWNSPMRLLQSALQLGRLLRKERPDILLPYLTPPNILCGLTWRWTGAQVCIWNQRNGGIERIEPRIETVAARLTRGFISNSQQGADFLMTTFKLKSEQVRVIHNGVAHPEIRTDSSQWRMELQADRPVFLACMVANLHYGKDHVVLLRAWRKVKEQLECATRKAVLVLAGRFDSMHDTLRRLVHELGLTEDVRFLGQVKDVFGLLKCVDLGVLTSPYEDYEGCPNAVLEYMACGLPVVGSNICGIRDLVDVSGHPFLVPIGDVDTLADRIVHMALNSELRVKLGEANRRRAIEEFSIDRMCKNAVTFILECLKI
jgi:glycosyltransferase involved in cell wall biosynthesis